MSPDPSGWNPGGSFHPDPTGLELEPQDCPRCGLPTLNGETAGDRERIRLDAMPVRAFEERFGETQRGVVYPAHSPQYVEHVCPIGDWR